MSCLRDKNLALDHYKMANLGFDQNHRIYSEKLKRNMAK
jgi:hypothetical protein